MSKAELLFIKYCEENKLEKVQACLTLAQDFEVDINAVDGAGWTAAHRAAIAGNTEVIRILAATAVDWNKKDVYGRTPLHMALFPGHPDVAGIIMKQDNVNFNLKTQSGRTAARAAVLGGSVRCVELLAEKENCDSWNIPDTDGVTPLMLAVRQNCKNILKVLLNCPRVDPNMEDQHGNSPVMMAIKEKMSVMAKMLIQCPRVNLGKRDRNGASLQRIAREQALHGICDLLFDAMIDQLEEKKTELTINTKEKIPECPVCLDQFKKDHPVYSCPVGHHLCGACKANIQVCPTCKRPVSGEGRAHDFEKLVSDLWG